VTSSAVGVHVPRPTWRFRVVATIVIVCVSLVRWRVRTEGLDRVPRSGGAVITWNHTSHVDFLITLWDVYRQLDRPCRYVALRELWSSKLFGWVPRFADAVPVDRVSDGDRDRALRDAVQALRDGHLVLVAPEGRISPSFEVQRWRTGAVRMAQLAGVPVIPSVSWGTHRLVTTGHRFSPRAAWRIPVTVRFGTPVHVPIDADPVEVTEQLRATTAMMLDEVQRGYPDGAPAGAWWVPARLGGGAPPHPAPS
jgi:1-acyl-sn-glycerol-3-phosphate acyltransferase